MKHPSQDTANRHLLNLLNIVKNNRSLEDLLELGLDYSQVSRLLVEVMNSGYVERGNNSLVLTIAGEQKLNQEGQLISSSTTGQWIIPADKSRIPKLDKFDIYLPSRENLGL